MVFCVFGENVRKREQLKLMNHEMPYERFKEKGPESLSDAELLAIILRTGTKGENATHVANKVLALSETSDLMGLRNITLEELTKIRGIGEVKAIKLKCITELSARLMQKHSRNEIIFQSPKAISDYYMESLRHLEQEHVIVLFLDGKNRLLGEKTVAVGTVNSAPVSTREILKEALRKNAVSIILLHNHPSGDSTPSKEDILTTERLKNASLLMNIPLLDHIIIGDCEYTSLKDKGLL